MLATILEISDYRLTDLLNSAGATVGVIICGTIFLQFMSTKRMALVTRFRDFATEYRAGQAGESRHTLLQSEIRLYRRRLGLMSWASWIAALSLLLLLAGVLAGGLSILFPPFEVFKLLGTGGLFLGLGLMGVGVLLELIESVLGRREFDHEIGDLDEPVTSGMATGVTPPNRHETRGP